VGENFCAAAKPDGEAFIDCIMRRASPRRVHFVELYLDAEVQDAIALRFGLEEGLDSGKPDFRLRRQVAIQRFLGYDYVVAGAPNLAIDYSSTRLLAEDGGALKRAGGRSFVNESRGPVTNWAEFEAFAWPSLDPDTADLEWYERELPDDMCLIGGLTAHVAEDIIFLMGYERLCLALYDEPEQFRRVAALWGTDDMGFKTGPLLSPDQLRELVFPAHAEYAMMSHNAGRPYLLHSCGKLDLVMDDLIDGVGIDAKHSFEDVIEDVREAKARWGSRIALLGGIDMDFICRADEDSVRGRVRETLEACQGPGYCLGTGNSVANYVPLGNYLAMLDEGRRWPTSS
jgi:uroporphyrinogen decarboxylase